ncbi:response regulator [Neptunicella sp. SCSIO 80796]|uniref:response regulator n=1 Tax=Neptunicella plasticusilytica TaxID=3117012 RepID=UPI003A4D4CE9
MQPKSLLLIDDDLELTELLTEYLSPQEYSIDVAHDGKTGLTMATSAKHFDLILLDVMLPVMDGFEVLKKLRQTDLTPVLMLTAKGDDFDRIFGLEMGADDYLPKPFNPRELSARIKAIVRRIDHLANNQQQLVLSTAELVLNPTNQTLQCNTHPIELTGTEFGILHILMSHCGNLVSKQQLSEQVLGRKLAAFDRSIDMHVSNLRKKIGQYSENEKIKTVRGSGYIFTESLV